MMRKIIVGILLLGIGIVPLFQHEASGQTEEEVTKMIQALPLAAAAEPKAPRKILIVTYCGGYRHSAIPYATRAVSLMGAITGAFSVEVSDSLDPLRSSKELKRFDAILLNNTTGWPLKNEANIKKNLLNFVASGGGLIGIHAATDNFTDWPEGQELIGGHFDQHPWHSAGTWRVRIDDPTHPLVSMFPAEGFFVNDEIYRIRSPLMRTKRRVLLSLDFSDSSTAHAGGVRPTDIDVPISWIANYGKGRVFYCSLGHNHEIYWNAAVLRHYLDGIQFALGDLKADAVPSFFYFLDRCRNYQYGQSQFFLTRIEEMLRASSQDERLLRRYCSHLIEALRQDFSVPAKKYFLRLLSVYGSAESVPVIASFLRDSQLWDYALYALERIDGDAARSVLRKKLPKAAPKQRSGIISALGRLRDKDAVELLAKEIFSQNAPQRHAAAAALGQIATDRAVETLWQAAKKFPAEQSVYLAALLRSTEYFLKAGKENQAISVAKAIYQNPDYPSLLRGAALSSWVRISEEGAGRLLAEALGNSELPIRRAAIMLIRELVSARELEWVAKNWGQYDRETQQQILLALGERRDSTFAAFIQPYLEDTSSSIRMAAISALGQCARAQDIKTLLHFAAAGTEQEKATAREALSLLNVHGIDEVLLRAVSNAKANEREAAIDILRRRGASEALATVVEQIDNQNVLVRLAVYEFLEELADSSYLPVLLAQFPRVKNSKETRSLQSATLSVARKSPAGYRSQLLLGAARKQINSQTRKAIVLLMGDLGDEEFVPYLRKLISSAEPVLRDAAISAAGKWQSVSLFEALYEAAKTYQNDRSGTLALRSMIEIVGRDRKLSAEERFRMLQQLWPLCHRKEEQGRWLSILGKVSTLSALQQAAAIARTSQAKVEAQLAALSIASNMVGIGTHTEDIRKILLELVSEPASEQIKKEAQNLLEKLKRDGQ